MQQQEDGPDFGRFDVNAIANGFPDTAETLLLDTYLTDGVKLLRIAHTLPCSVEGELFLALEDCATLEIVLCAARALGESGLRSVTPAGVS